MKFFSILCVLVLVAGANVGVNAQEEYVSGEKIEAGMYREIATLRLSGVENVQMQAATERQFRVLSTVIGRAGMYREVVAPTTWSMSGGEGASIDANGKLAIAATVPHGTRFRIVADVVIKEPWEEKGNNLKVEQNVIVFDPKENPLVGDWTQKFVTLCRGKRVEADGNTGLRSLEFRADGTFSAAVAPFEAYRDYWGRYTFDAAKRTLELTVDGGNNEPGFRSAHGSIQIKDGELTISGIRLYPRAQGPEACKAHFTR